MFTFGVDVVKVRQPHTPAQTVFCARDAMAAGHGPASSDSRLWYNKRTTLNQDIKVRSSFDAEYLRMAKDTAIVYGHVTAPYKSYYYYYYYYYYS